MPKKNAISAKLDVMFRLIHKCELEEIRNALNSQDGFSGAELVKANGRKNGDYLVTVAARHGRVDVLTLLKDDFNASLEVANHDGKRPIHEAAQSGHVACVSYLIRAGVDVDALKRATWTPLMLACTKDDLNVIQILMEQGGATFHDLKNKDGWTCFHIACREGHRAILQYFLKSNGQLWKTRSNVLRTPLHTASLNGKTDAVRLLIDSVDYEELNRRDVCGATPLTDAIKGGHPEIVKILLETQSRDSSSILSNEFDSLGRRPLDLAAMFGRLDIFSIVLEASISAATTTAPSESRGPEESSSVLSSSSILRDVLQKRNGDRGRIPLHYAALEGQTSVVEWIVTEMRAGNCRDDDILVIDEDGNSPLHLALLGKHSCCAELLTNGHSDIAVAIGKLDKM